MSQPRSVVREEKAVTFHTLFMTDLDAPSTLHDRDAATAWAGQNAGSGDCVNFWGSSQLAHAYTVVLREWQFTSGGKYV